MLRQYGDQLIANHIKIFIHLGTDGCDDEGLTLNSVTFGGSGWEQLIRPRFTGAALPPRRLEQTHFGQNANGKMQKMKYFTCRN